MPHQCTNCGRRFEDGSKEMLSGCPDCGGNKFQFIPGSADRERSEPTATSPESSRQSTLSDQGSSDERPITDPSTRHSSDTSSSPSADATADATTSTDTTADATTSTDTTADASTATPEEPESPPEPSSRTGSAVGSAKSAAEDFLSSVTGRGTTDDSDAADRDEVADPTETDDADIIEADDDLPSGRAADHGDDDEDLAQHDARSATVETDELREAREQMAREATGNDVGESSDAPEAVERSNAVDAAMETAPAVQRTASPERPGDDDTRPDADVRPDDDARPDATGDAEPAHHAPDETDGEAEQLETPADPDLAQLRAELNDQFESIKIVAPGQYELNLMELYDREEYVISLQEDGRYVIEVPDAWDAEPED